MLNRPCTRSKAGFSLVELSIVLVILGLLVGGILAGQSLIRAAELRAVSSEKDRFTTALGAFRDKYFALPGDFSKATDFGWANGGNGNGNGMIEASATAAQNEASTFWTHLSSAGLIEGNFTNVPNTTAFTLGTHNPRSKINTAGWNVLYLGNIVAANTDHFPGTYGNALFFGANGAAGAYSLPGEVIKPEEAWNLDTKVDDGRPDLGGVLTMESDTTCGTTAGYVLTQTGNTCALIFKSNY